VSENKTLTWQIQATMPKGIAIYIADLKMLVSNQRIGTGMIEG
jgi:nickel-dependent lactate racemase